MFLPQCYRKIHETIISDSISRMASKELSWFQKVTLARHANGYYLPVKMNFKLVIGDDGLMMEGYLEILRSQAYE